MTGGALPAAAAPRGKGPLDALVAAVAANRDPDALVVTSLPLPDVPLEGVLSASPSLPAAAWLPPDGPATAALGAVAELTAEGPERFGLLRAAAGALFASVIPAPLAEGAPPPRCFGGLAFAPGAARADGFAPFGDARFFLPRLTVTRAGDRTWLSLAARGAEAATEARSRALVTEAEALLTALRAPRPAPPRQRAVVSRAESSAADWAKLVDELRARIDAGEFEKVVIARRTTLELDPAPEPAEVLAELAAASDRATRFGFRFGGATFLGATPERLVRRTGLVVETEALAGSSRSEEERARGHELLGSAKERREQALVLREILRSLGPLVAELEHAAEPEVRRLRHLSHLRTAIRARLHEPVHVLDLAARLHPTPAVGGIPGPAALSFLTAREPSPRGWYASPVGWFDASGDGEFAVGLRSGLLSGRRADLYAGGGIVAGSEPAAEYAETELKLATLLAALRVPR